MPAAIAGVIRSVSAKSDKIHGTMDEVAEIRQRLRLTMLRAQIALREIERIGLTAEIDDPLTAQQRKVEATTRRAEALVEWGEIMTELAACGDIPAVD